MVLDNEIKLAAMIMIFLFLFITMGLIWYYFMTHIISFEGIKDLIYVHRIPISS